MSMSKTKPNDATNNFTKVAKAPTKASTSTIIIRFFILVSRCFKNLVRVFRSVS